MVVSGSITNISRPFRMSGIKVTVPAPNGCLGRVRSHQHHRVGRGGRSRSFTLSYYVWDPPSPHGALIASGVPGYAYDWTMTNAAIGSNVTITITDGVFTNESERFEVVAAPSIPHHQPAPGQYWKVSETNVVRWSRAAG